MFDAAVGGTGDGWQDGRPGVVCRSWLLISLMVGKVGGCCGGV